MKFPVQFEERMLRFLGESEYQDFMNSYHQSPHTGLRVNTRKITVKDFLAIFPYALEPIPWTDDGFYYDSSDSVTQHPYFYAGLYYIQEPSAMAPVNALEPHPDDFCLDLCAAPGGKSMQIANKIEDSGLLVSNDIHETRVKAILRNVEKFGLRNVIVLNATPDQLASRFSGVFNKVLIDAPCSGEGMFKKDTKAVQSWEKYGPELCSGMQWDILKHLHKFVAPKAMVVYSTCTFSEQENENQMTKMLESGEFDPCPINLNGIDADGHMAHIWPHKHRGEGHFISKLIAKGFESVAQRVANESNTPPNELAQFIKSHVITDVLSGCYQVVKERIYLLPDYKLPLEGLKIVREGLLVGELKNGRFLPSQALAMYLSARDFSPIIDFQSNGSEVMKYLKGETLHVSTDTQGYHLVCTDGYPLGFAKIDQGVLKNLYPPSWRKL